MSPITLATFSELTSVTWFSRLGQRDLEDSVDFVTTWGAALEAMSDGWDEVREHAMNAYESRVHQSSQVACQEWDEKAKTIGSSVGMMMRLHVEPALPAKVPEKERILKSVYTDLFGLGIECEYAAIAGPSFFAGASFFYARGHFPCGWRGPRSPQGRLVVF